VDSLVGTVEMIGMRSTRIRTADRTLVSIPNGKLADMRIETFAARDRIRLAFTFGLTYSTTESQLRSVLSDFDSALRANPKVWPEGCSVRFKELGDSALIIEVGCSFITTQFDEFTDLRQETLLALMKIVERNGAEFAFPTRTLQIANSAAQSGIAPPAVSGQRWDLPPDQRFRDGSAG
jgi:MscS family membrane protein